MNNQVRPYQPLTSENAALVLVDHQVGLMSGVRDISTGELKHNVVALAKAAKALKLPIIVTTTARDSMWGPTFPELVEALPGIEIIDRSSVNAFDDVRVSRAIEATDRKKLIFAGISLEVCAAFPAGHSCGQRVRRLCDGRRLRNIQRDQAASWAPAHATGRCYCLGLYNLDGRNPQRQCATGGRRSVRGHGYGLGQACRSDRPGLQKVNQPAGSPDHVAFCISATLTRAFLATFNSVTLDGDDP